MRKFTVLVVDDDPGSRMVVAASLAGEAFEVRSASDATEARTVPQNEPVDVLLLDVMMPGETGIELCRSLRTQPTWDALPVVMMSALDAGRHRYGALDLGADDWIDKPVDPDDLQRTVHRWALAGRTED